MDVTELLAVRVILQGEAVVGTSSAGEDEGTFGAPAGGEGYGSQAGGDALAKGRGLRGERVEGEVLRVAVAVAAPGGDEDVCEEDEEEERYDGGDYESLQGWMLTNEVLVSLRIVVLLTLMTETVEPMTARRDTVVIECVAHEKPSISGWRGLGEEVLLGRVAGPL
jgi:hypothetical protein